MSQPTITVKTLAGMTLRLQIHSRPTRPNEYATAELLKGAWPSGSQLAFAIEHDVTNLRADTASYDPNKHSIWFGTTSFFVSEQVAGKVRDWLTKHCAPAAQAVVA